VGLVLGACTAGALVAMGLRVSRHGGPVELQVQELVRVRGGQPVLVLVEKGGARKLPVPVGHAEAALIERALGGPRGLLPASLEALGGRVLRASIDQVESDRSFRGHLEISSGARELWLEASAGEALALAIQAGAPVVARSAVLEEAGVSPADLHGKSARNLRTASDPAPVERL